MSATFDVAVIGGGVTGVSAALAAQRRGARVCVVRAAPGSSALVSGAWSGPLRAELQAPLAAAGLSLLPVKARLAHERGHTVSADFAGASHVGATIESDALVCGFAGLPHFHAPTLARLWNRERPWRARTIELAGTPAGGWTAASLASAIERDPAALAAHLRDHHGRVVFPAVLGIDRVPEVTAALAAHGIEAAEALAASPSLPGWRLQRALDRAISTNGIGTFAGRAVLERSSGRRAEALRVDHELITANSFILATGKFLANGISSTDGFRENVFDLPVWVDQLGDVFTAADALPLTDPVRTAPQPLLYAGVHTNEASRPVDRANQVVFDNVYAAGTVRAGWAAAESRLGDCAEDGWRAGLNATA